MECGNFHSFGGVGKLNGRGDSKRRKRTKITRKNEIVCARKKIDRHNESSSGTRPSAVL